MPDSPAPTISTSKCSVCLVVSMARLARKVGRKSTANAKAPDGFRDLRIVLSSGIRNDDPQHLDLSIRKLSNGPPPFETKEYRMTRPRNICSLNFPQL